MTDREIVEAMMEIDPHGDWHIKGIFNLDDHNAVQRVIDGMDDICDNYPEKLAEVVGCDMMKHWENDEIFQCLKATPRQKCEAILKAKGVWKDD